MSDSNDFTVCNLIYAGRFENQKGALSIAFYHADNPKQAVSFADPKRVREWRTAAIGGIYEAERNGDTYRFGRKLVRMSGDERTTSWVARDETAEVAVRTRKHMRKLAQEQRSLMETAIKPFRDEYLRTDTIGRLAMEVILLKALRHGI